MRCDQHVGHAPERVVGRQRLGVGDIKAGPGEMLSAPVDVYRRPYEGTGVGAAAMQAYLDWEHGLVAQLGRDGTHGFAVLT